MRSKQQGFTLVEVMVSLIITTVFLTVLLQLYIILAKYEHKTNNALLQLLRFKNFYTHQTRQAEYPEDRLFYQAINKIHNTGTFTRYALNEESQDQFSINVFSLKESS